MKIIKELLNNHSAKSPHFQAMKYSMQKTTYQQWCELCAEFNISKLIETSRFNIYL